MTLPNELLIDIFESLPGCNKHKTVIKVALACHRFKDLILPQLYQTIEIGLWYQKRNKLRLLVSTLQSNQALGDCCQYLFLAAGNSSKESLRLYTALFWALPRLRILCLRTAFHSEVPRFWDEIGTVLSFAYALEHADIGRIAGILPQGDVIRTLDGAIYLRTLTLDGVRSDSEAKIQSPLPITLTPRVRILC